MFYKDYGLPSEKKFSITFNEQLNKFITFNSWYPFFSRNINNIFFTFGLNDRIGFEKHLFGGSSEDLNRVLSQLSTYANFSEAQEFIEDMVKWY